MCFLVKKPHLVDSAQKTLASLNINLIKDLKICRALKAKRVTRVELNRRARRKEQLRAEAEAKKVEKLSSEIDR